MGPIATRVLAEFCQKQIITKIHNRRRVARQHLQLNPHWSVPVVFDDGSAAPPRLMGESFYYETQGGVRVRYPNAYRRVAKSARLDYIHSTHRIVVGADWLGFAGL